MYKQQSYVVLKSFLTNLLEKIYLLESPDNFPREKILWKDTYSFILFVLVSRPSLVLSIVVREKRARGGVKWN